MSGFSMALQRISSAETLAIAAGLVLVVLFVALAVILVLRRPGRVVRPDGARFAIALSTLANDPGRKTWRTLAQSLRGSCPELAVVRMKGPRASLSPGVSPRTIARWERKAVGMIEGDQNRVDAIVWGSADLEGHAIKLKVVSPPPAEGLAFECAHDVFTLNADLAQDRNALALASYVLAVSEPTDHNRDAFFTTSLAPVCERLTKCLEQLPSDVSGVERCRLRQAHAIGALRCFDLTGEIDHLSAAHVSARFAVVDGRRAIEPEEWASAQGLLAQIAAARSTISHQGDRAREAVVAFRAALSIATIPRSPRTTAILKLGLAESLVASAIDEVGVETLDEAAGYAQEALSILEGDQRTGRAQLVLATARSRAGARAAGLDRLRTAVNAYQELLGQLMGPEPSAVRSMAQNGLAETLRRMGERQRDPGPLLQSIAAYHDALKARSRERQPLLWAESLAGLGEAHLIAGERGLGLAHVSEASTALRQATQVFEEAGAHRSAAQTRKLLARAERSFAERLALEEI